MFVQPINAINQSRSYAQRTKHVNFKSVDYSAYANHDGSPIPDIERLKYSKTRLADQLEQLGKLKEAADEWFDIARICRSQGKERDAYLCDEAAHKLLRRIHL